MSLNIGLVLGCGWGRGAANLVVLQFLHEHRLRFQHISRTSLFYGWKQKLELIH